MGNRKLWLVGLLVVAAAAVAVWRWRARERDAPERSTVTQPTAAPQAARPAAASSRARITVRVTGDKGPIANAIVRLAPDDGEVLAIRTNAEGVARSDALAPGEWAVSASAADHEPAALPAHALKAGDDAQLAIKLAAGGRTLTGLVTDVNGGPIAGARIDAARLGRVLAPPQRSALRAAAEPGLAVATALTGPDGTYRLTVAEGLLLVAARSADYAAQSRYVEVGPSGATADFALVPGGVIEGIVLDDKTRAPVPGAVVGARRERSSAVLLAESGSHRVVAGGDGRFRIAGLRPGVYELEAAAEARRSKSDTLVGLGVAEQVAEVELLVGVGAVIRGKVVDESEAPVANAVVRAFSGGDQGEARADAKGAFALEGLSPGRYALFAHGESHVRAGHASIVLQDKDVDVVVRVKRGATLRGHVEPRQVADVRIEPGEGDVGALLAALAPVTTKADGEFELSPLALGKAELSARCPSGDQGSMQIEIGDGMPEVVLKVTPGASIAGRVLDGEGKPVAGATVLAAALGGTETTMIVNGLVTSGAQVLSSLDGTYEVKGLAPGTYRMTALDRGRPLRMRKPPPRVALAAVEKKTGVDLAVDRANGVIKGVVSGPDGTPLADVWVSALRDVGSLIEGMAGGRGDEPPPAGGESRMMRVEARDDEGGGAAASDLPPALTDAQGRFEMRGLPHGTYEVVAEAQAGKLRGRAAGVKPDATVNVRAIGVTSLSGTVRGPQGPTALFTIELDGPTRAQRTFTDGAFVLGRVDPGAYTVRVRSSDGNAEQKVEVIAGKPTEVDITLVANAIVVGTVVDQHGKPLAGIPVTVVEDRGGGGVEVRLEGPPPTSGPDGRFRIEHEAGPGTLVVMVPPRPVTKRGLTLEPGKTLDVGAIRVDRGSRAP